jgi:hypothetical protein
MLIVVQVRGTGDFFCSVGIRKTVAHVSETGIANKRRLNGLNGNGNLGTEDSVGYAVNSIATVPDGRQHPGAGRQPTPGR